MPKRAMMQDHLRMMRKVSTEESGWIVSIIAQGGEKILPLIFADQRR
jgi:hypothetical protein